MPEKSEEIIVHKFAQLGVSLSTRAAPDREHALDAGVEQAFAQNALPDHAGCAEQNDLHPGVGLVHPLMKAKRSALMVSAWVVGMPCGKPG